MISELVPRGKEDKAAHAKAEKAFLAAVQREKDLLTEAAELMAAAIQVGQQAGLTMDEMARLRGNRSRQTLYYIRRKYGQTS